MQTIKVHFKFFCWESALWTLNSQDRVMLLLRRSQKSIAIFGYKQSLLSVENKSCSACRERESEWESESCESSAFVWHSDIVWSLLRNVPGCCLYLQFHGVFCYNVWVSRLAESPPCHDRDPCFRCLHVSLPMWQTKTWPTFLDIALYHHFTHGM